MEGLVIPLNHVLIVAALLFVIGLAGLMFRRNIIFVLMALEVMLNAAALAFVAAGGWPSYLHVDTRRCGRRSFGRLRLGPANSTTI